jgi:DNA-binding winged helix-turn-helix (wHTH) protein
MSGSRSDDPQSSRPPHAARRLRFGTFEVDLQEHELRDRGLRVSIQEKPFQLLQVLLERPGELISRAELRHRLWPDLHVDFDHSLNTAVNALRQALKDSPRQSQFIETRPGLGYRFVACVDAVTDSKSRSNWDDKPEYVAAPRWEDRRGDTAEARLVEELSESINAGLSAFEDLRMIAKKLSSAPQQRRSGNNHTTSFEAYQDYRRGRHFLDKTNEDDLHRGIGHFEAALLQNRQYAPAYSGVADAYCLFALLDVVRAGDAYCRANTAATTALHLGDASAEAHASLGRVRMLFEWDWAGAEAEYLKAIDLDPEYAPGHQWYAGLLAATGRNEEAIERIHEALDLDPVSLATNLDLAWILYLQRHFDEAANQSWKTLVLEPRCALAQYLLGLAYQHTGLKEEAITEFQNSETCSGGRPSTTAALGYAFAQHGERREALGKLRELEQMANRRFVPAIWRCILHTGLDEQELAVAALGEAIEQRDVSLVWIAVEPRLDPLRGDPRFTQLLRKVHALAG